jgi:hypothetical protein
MKRTASHSNFLGLIACLLAILMSVSSLTAQVPTDAEKEKIIKALAELKDILENGSGSNNLRALQLLQSAVSSNKETLKLYMAAVKEIDFDETGKKESDWRDWRDKNEETLSSTSHIRALQFQIHYLILTIKATSGKNAEEPIQKVMPDLIAYLDKLSTDFEDFTENTNILRGSVLESYFGRQAKLNVTVDRKRPWAFNPLGISEIYDKSILPFYREKKDLTNLQGAWDKRIVHEGKLYGVEKGLFSGSNNGRRGYGRADQRDIERAEEKEEDRKLDQALNEFRKERMPILTWGKQRDVLFFGSNKTAALSAMIAHIKDHLDHKDVKIWIEEISNFLNADIYDPESFYDKVEAKK